MNSKTVFTLTILSFFISLSQAQDPSKIKKELHQKAIEGKYGILYCQVGGTAVTTSSQGFTGLIDISITSNRMDTLLSRPDLQNEEAQKSLLQISRQLVTKGVELRKANQNWLSLLCYRLPLYVVCKQEDWNGARVISGNLWTASEQLKHTLGNNIPEIATALELAKKDATLLLNTYRSNWDKQYLLKTPEANHFFLLYRRIADLAGNSSLSSSIVLQKLKQPDPANNSIYLNALLEELAQVSGPDFLLTDKMDPEGKDHNKYFKEIWKQYKEYRFYLQQQPDAFINILPYALRQFDLTRLQVVSAGGSFGHKLSYQVSEYMQLLGRDLAMLYALKGDPLQALEEAESVRGRALGDWIARSHPTTRFKMRHYGYGSAKDKPFMELQPASLGEIGAAVQDNNTNLLIYLNIQNGYQVWLITPQLKLYNYFIKDADSMVNKLLGSLPFNVVPAGQQSTVNLVSRGGKMSNSGKKEDQQRLLSDVYAKLLPDSIGIHLQNSPESPLVIIPDGLLNYVPFQALKSSKDKYLLQNHEISYWPSVTGWLVLKDAETVFNAGTKDSATGNRIQVMGNPQFNGTYTTMMNGKEQAIKLDPLPGTLTEINAIGSMFNVKIVQQQEVVTGKILGERQRLEILHLATHGYTNTEDGMRSFIAFSNGPLYAADLYENAGILKSRLVVLSACQTGLGMLMNDSPVSLTNAFLIGGANSVISTLWSIDDAASAALMEAFYKGLKEGKLATVALRGAQLQLMQNPKWSSPFYWAAFKVNGLNSNPLTR